MDKRISSHSGYYISSAISRPKYGEFGSCPIDKVTAQSFNVDPCTGRPMSDIDYIIRAKDASQEMAMFMSLNEFKSNFLPSDMSEADALRFSIPRLSQTPAELADLAVRFHKYNLDKADSEKKAKELEDYRMLFDKDETNSNETKSE